jgi:hypothetical protein
MAAALVCYTLLNLAILGFIILFVRASRARAAPNERRDLEENSLVTADWEWVRRERCLPSGCPRLWGQPLRPRKDVTCEICAATFLEIRLQRLLEGPPAPEPIDSRTGRRAGQTESGSAHPGRSTSSPVLTLQGPGREPDVRVAGTKRPRVLRRGHLGSAAHRWASLSLTLGLGCVAAGTAVAAFGGVEWWVVLGSLIALLGLGLIAVSAAWRTR